METCHSSSDEDLWFYTRNDSFLDIPTEMFFKKHEFHCNGILPSELKRYIVDKSTLLKKIIIIAIEAFREGLAQGNHRITRLHHHNKTTAHQYNETRCIL